METYDMGFSVRASDLPEGRLRFRLSSLDEDMLTEDIDMEGSADVKSLTFELTCHKVDKKGRKLRNPLDKRWLLWITTDPSTKLLVVDEQKELPVWCSICRHVIPSMAYRCDVCTDFHICWDCLKTLRTSKSHDKSHRWTCVEETLGSDTE